MRNGNVELRMLEISVPEYFATHLGKVEQIAGGCVRLYICVRKGDHLEPVYTTVWPLETLMRIRAGLVDILASEVHGSDFVTH